MTTNQIAGYDFTINAKEVPEVEVLINWLRSRCKKWVFQLESGEETGYLHYQGRLSLNVKKRMHNFIADIHQTFPTAHVSPTMLETFQTSNFSYVMKEDTRVKGPWKDTDRELPRQLRNLTLRPWQQKIWDSKNTFDDRIVNILYDPRGNIGKTTISNLIGATRHGINIPALKDSKDIMRMVMDQEKLGMYLIDMPRAMKKENLEGMYSAIEQIKGGYAYDDRYHFKSEYFDAPTIWVFTNTIPDGTLLSKDRWRIWIVVDEKLRLFNGKP